VIMLDTFGGQVVAPSVEGKLHVETSTGAGPTLSG